MQRTFLSTIAGYDASLYYHDDDHAAASARYLFE
jgi:hypothetical protein